MSRFHSRNKNGPIQPVQNVLQQQQQAAFNIVTTFDFAKFQAILLRWIVCTNISFSEVEHPEFRELLTHCNAVLGDLLPRSHNTISSWIQRDFEMQKTHLRLEFHRHEGQVHISFDMWTSANALALLGVVEHWVGIEGSV